MLLFKICLLFVGFCLFFWYLVCDGLKFCICIIDVGCVYFGDVFCDFIFLRYCKCDLGFYFYIGDIFVLDVGFISLDVKCLG